MSHLHEALEKIRKNTQESRKFLSETTFIVPVKAAKEAGYTEWFNGIGWFLLDSLESQGRGFVSAAFVQRDKPFIFALALDGTQITYWLR